MTHRPHGAPGAAGGGGVRATGGGRVLGLDVGEKTVGVAISDPEGLTAQPLRTLLRRPDAAELDQLRALVEEYGVKEVVVGLPTRTDGTAGVEARRVRAFAQRLQTACGVVVHFVDERFSTVQAERMLLEAGLSRRRRRQAINHVVAAILLDTFLARRRVKGDG